LFFGFFFGIREDRMKKLVQFAAVFFACFLWFSTVRGEDWIYYSSYPDFLFYDRENINNPIENSQDILGVWKKIVYAESSVARISEHLGERYADLRESVSLVEINCLSKEVQTKAVTYYDSRGAVIYTSHRTKDSWEEIIPESPLNKIYKAVCPSQ
jgi:hypothetical protein